MIAPLNVGSNLLAGVSPTRAQPTVSLIGSPGNFPGAPAASRYLSNSIPLRWKTKLPDTADLPDFFVKSTFAPGDRLDLLDGSQIVASRFLVENTSLPTRLGRPPAMPPIPRDATWRLTSSSSQPLLPVGFDLERVEYSCNQSPAPAVTDIVEDEPVIGVLSGTGDTHFFRVVPPAGQSSLWQPH